MKVLFDTSAVVALLVNSHPHHLSANATFKKLRSQKADLFLANHTIAELYSTLTRGISYLDYTGEQAEQLINKTISNFELVDISSSHYLEVVSWLASKNLTGAIIYDALISKSASLIDAAYLVTFNAKDFQRIFPENGADLIIPG